MSAIPPAHQATPRPPAALRAPARAGPARFLLALALAPLLALTGALAPAGVALAQSSGRSVQAIRYDVDLAVQPGGDLLVTETQEIAFKGGPFQSGFRRISTSNLEGVRDVRVEEPGQPYRPGAQTPFTFSVSGATSGGGGDVRIDWWFPPASNATRTFVVSFRAVGAVRYYPGGDQIRWDALTADRPYPVARSTIKLTLPADVPSGGWKQDAYPGRYVDGRETSAQGASATWVGTNVPANEPFQVRAQWPHGLVPGSPPSWQAAADAADVRNESLRPVFTVLGAVAGILVPLLGGLAILLRWYTRGRDPKIAGVPAELPEPPSDLPPAVAGTLVDEHADAQDVIATVLDLAARGIIAITEVQDPQLAGSPRDFELTLVGDPPAGLRPYEKSVLDSFFARGNPVRLSHLGDWFHEAIPFIQRALHREAVQAGLFLEDPDVVRRRYQRAGTVIALGGVALAAMVCSAVPPYASAVQWPFFGLALVGVMLWLAANRMPKRTAVGALEAARWRAYARYLAKAGPDVPAPARGGNGAAGPPDGHDEAAVRRGSVFERTLPYAVALGIDRSWVKKFATVGTAAPRWFQPPVVAGGPGWGPMGPMGPMVGPWGVPYGGGHRGRWGGAPGAPAPGAPPGQSAPGPAGPDGWSGGAAGGLDRASGSLADLLNAASEVLGRGGSGGWSGGGSGGGSFGGGGSGGSGGGGSGFQ